METCGCLNGSSTHVSGLLSARSVDFGRSLSQVDNLECLRSLGRIRLVPNTQAQHWYTLLLHVSALEKSFLKDNTVHSTNNTVALSSSLRRDPKIMINYISTVALFLSQEPEGTGACAGDRAHVRPDRFTV